MRDAGPALQAAAGEGLGLRRLAQRGEHHGQIVLDGDAPAVVGVALEQLGQRVVGRAHLATEPMDLALEAQQRGVVRRRGPELGQPTPGGRDVGLAHGQLDQHLVGVDAFAHRQLGQQRPQARGLRNGAGQVAGEDTVVHQGGAQAAIDETALIRVGHAIELGFDGQQRGLAPGEVFQQIASRQLQAGPQRLGQVQRSVGDLLPHLAGFVVPAAGLELLRALVAPGECGLRLASLAPMQRDGHGVGPGLLGEPQRHMAVQRGAPGGRQMGQGGLANEVVTASEARGLRAQHAGGQRFVAGLQPEGVACLAAGQAEQTLQACLGHGLHEHGRRLHRLERDSAERMQAALHHLPDSLRQGLAEQHLRGTSGHQLTQREGVASAELVQAVELLGAEVAVGPARAAHGGHVYAGQCGYRKGFQSAGCLQALQGLGRTGTHLVAACSSPPGETVPVGQHHQPLHGSGVAPLQVVHQQHRAQCFKGEGQGLHLPGAGGEGVEWRQRLVRRKLGHEPGEVQPVPAKRVAGIAQRDQQCRDLGAQRLQHRPVGHAMQAFEPAQAGRMWEGRCQQGALAGAGFTHQQQGRRGTAPKALVLGRACRGMLLAGRIGGRGRGGATVAQPAPVQGQRGLGTPLRQAVVAIQLPALRPVGRVQRRAVGGGGRLPEGQIGGQHEAQLFALGLQTVRHAPLGQQCARPIQVDAQVMHRFGQRGVGPKQRCQPLARQPGFAGPQHQDQGTGQGGRQALRRLVLGFPRGRAEQAKHLGAECRLTL